MQRRVLNLKITKVADMGHPINMLQNVIMLLIFKI